jgi:MYXO-CTERM domain-containing protein
MTIRFGFGVCALALFSLVVSACSRGDGNGSTHAAPTAAAPAAHVPTVPNFVGGPPDDSQSVVQRHAQVAVAYPSLSAPFADIPPGPPSEERFEREPRRSPFPFAAATQADPVIQAFAPITSALTVTGFLGQGDTLGGCIYPKPDMGEPAGCTTTGDPPDTNGAVGLNDYVQVVNGGVAVWSKSGSLRMPAKYLNTLWAGYTGTNAGNACATQNDGDPVVLYDQLADRWFITQFSLPNYDSNKGPSFQCVAVSQTSDPLGAWNRYDFQYSAMINDYGKFGVWSDAYYASFNNFNPSSQGANVCAYDRTAMLAGGVATQHCFQQSAATFAMLPSSLDGPIKPPNGEPGFFVRLKNGTSISLYKFHADFATPANTTFTGPTNLTVASYAQLCGGGDCVAQKTAGNALASLGDRPMFHLSYRNFGTVESLVFNHSVTAGTTGGPRWYEIRSPNATPVVFQQGTFAPADGKYRWMGSISQDQAQDLALGYSVSSSTTVPAIAWTGRVATDAAGTMGQGETVVQTGVGVETGTFSDGSTATRWGDYSNMSVDPTDDCTFWYTTEYYPGDGVFNWDTGISSAKFASCAQNNFSISLAPAIGTVMPGATATFTVTTPLTAGTAETITLVAQDLPTGVTAGFAPATVTAGGTSTLTLTAAGTAPTTGTPAPTFVVIGKATSAVHAAKAQVSVGACVKLTTCPSPDNCGTIPDGCGGTVSCGPACAAPQTCGGAGMVNVCGCTATTCVAQNAECGMISDGCGAMLTCPSCTGDTTCVANKCVANTADLSVSTANDLSSSSQDDLATPPVTAPDLATGGGGGKGGCGCRIGGESGRTPPLAFFGLGLGFALVLLRRRLRAPA